MNGMHLAVAVLFGLRCICGFSIGWLVGIEDAVNHFFESQYVSRHSNDTGVNVFEVIHLFLGEQVPLEGILT